MVRIEDIARAAVNGEALQVRSMVQDWLAAQLHLAHVPRPDVEDSVILSVAAALVELFAMRREEPPPAWTASVGAISEPLFLLRHAAAMPRLRQLCEQESPEPLRRRRIYAPPDYLVAA